MQEAAMSLHFLVLRCVTLLLLNSSISWADLERNATSYSNTSTTEEALCHTVYLLNVMPYPDSDEMAGWDKGFELIPAGHLAAAHINNRSDILGSLKLEIVDIDSEACGRSLVTNGQFGLFENMMSTPCIAGVIGLFCSAVTELVVPLASHSMYGYTQLSSSTSPLLLNSDFPYLFRTISSSKVFNLAMIAIMDYFNWSRVSVIYDSMGIYFDSTGNNFATLVDSVNKSLLSTIQILPSSSRDISSIFETVNSVASTIGYYSVTVEESAAIMCEAFKRNQLWRDGHVYVFHERTIVDFLNSDVTCTREEMVTAIDGVFTLQYKLENSQSSGLIAGLSYETYLQEYLKELDKFAKETGMELEEGNEYANTLYDQVWAFALAINKSLDKVRLVNGSFEASYEATPKLRDVLTQQLKDVSFNGVSGQIRFGQEQETRTFIDIFQIRNGSAQHIAVFNSDTMNFSFEDGFDLQGVPDDMPKTVQYLLPLWLGATVLAVQTALLIMLIGNTVLLVYLRKSPEIKSASFFISLIIMAGCYFLCISSVLHAVYSSFYIANANVFLALCYMELWFSINGLNLVIVPLLFRLLRIYHVFASFRSTGKHWSDKYLICYIFLLCSVVLILLTVWNAVDPLRFVVSVMYIRPQNSPPYYMAYAHCSSVLTGLWNVLTYFWVGLLLVAVLLLAIKTRHIKRKNYKDTKKVNVFIFSQSLLLMTFIPLSSILVAVNVLIGAFIFKWLAFFLVAFLCQIFLFVPKIFPVLLPSRKKEQKPALARTSVVVSLNYTNVSKV